MKALLAALACCVLAACAHDNMGKDDMMKKDEMMKKEEMMKKDQMRK